MISLVDETLSDSRSISEASSTVGKIEKSSGRSMNSVTVNIRIASAKDSGQPDIQQPGRHRQDHHHDHRHQRQRQQHRRAEEHSSCSRARNRAA
jgi:hypothetical protein